MESSYEKTSIEENKPLPANCCQYCGNSSNVILAKCLTCGKFFCNGTGLNEGSHILIHMRIAKHKSFQLYSTNQTPGIIPKCCVCGCTNIFDLRLLKDKQGKVLGVVCLDKCISSMKLLNPAYKDIAYDPIIVKDGICNYIMPQVKSNPQAPVTLSFSLIRKVERLWAKHSSISITQVQLPKDTTVAPMRNYYTSTLEYYKIMEPLLRREEYEQKESASHDGTKHAYVTFQRQQQLKSPVLNKRRNCKQNTNVSNQIPMGKTEITIFASFTINADDYHRTIHRFDRLSLLLCDIQENYTVNNNIHKHPITKTDFEGMTNGRMKRIDLDDYNDGIDLDYSSFDYMKRIEYTGIITQFQDNKILLKIQTCQVPEGIHRFQQGFYDIRLMDSQAVLSRRLDAIKQLDNELSVPQYLYNKWMGDMHNQNYNAFQYKEGECTQNGDIVIPNLGKLNTSQIHAVETAIQRRLSLIQGPPGTGKTFTAAAIVYILTTRYRQRIRDIPIDGSTPSLPGPILVCTPSNLSADEVCVRIASTGVKVVRLMATSKEDQSNPIDELCVHIRAKKILNERDNEFKHIQAMWECNDSHLTEKDAIKRYKMMRKMKEEIIASAEVVVCTCDTAGCSLLKNITFNTVLIDEVSQSIEPEALVPVVHGINRLILIGDHKQLSPVIISFSVKQAGMERSIFERFIQQGELPVLLNTQYRMHPCIAYYPSITFYEGQVHDGITADKRPICTNIHYSNPIRPIQFVHVMGNEEISNEGTSYINLSEAMYIVELVQYLLQAGISLNQIGILTSYKGQQKLLVKLFNKVNCTSIECTNINAFQGREKDYIIYSCVRSNDNHSIGFVGDLKRMNVVLTRARYGLFIIGNSICLRNNSHWMNYIKYNYDNMQFVEGKPGNWTILK